MTKRKIKTIALWLIPAIVIAVGLWFAAGRPPLTAEGAFVRLRRSYLVEAETVAAFNGDPVYYNKRIAKNMIAMDDGHIYYAFMKGDPVIYWAEPGVWEVDRGLLCRERGEVLSFIPGDEQVAHWEGLKGSNQMYIMPVFVAAEEQAPLHDSIRVTTTLKDASDKYTFSGEAEADGGIVMVMQPVERNRAYEDEWWLWERMLDSLSDRSLYMYTFYSAELEIELLLDGETVYSERHTLMENDEENDHENR
ncbi:MAG: hypothetical protein IIW34_04685 [Clostridia bacterium]|nr:hypothetical protein [Clostridia bacterium]